MLFWIFMLACNLIIPLAMVLIGARFEGRGPKDINRFLGYRTAMSMKNGETWRFAHMHCGKLWKRLGAALIPVSALPLLCAAAFGLPARPSALAAGAVTIAQGIIMLGTVFLTERALKKRFDKDGSPISYD